MTERAPTRRSLLRNVAVGGVLGTTGGAGVSAFRDSPNTTTTESIDTEPVPANRIRSASFELETAWFVDHDGETVTSPAQSIPDFPTRFAEESGARIAFEDLEPDSTGRLLVAFRTTGRQGSVACWGDLEGSTALAETIEVSCWRTTDWDTDHDSSREAEIFRGPLSTFPTDPFAPTPCADRTTVHGLGVSYSLPELSDAAATAVEGESLRFEFNLSAEPCRTPDQ